MRGTGLRQGLWLPFSAFLAFATSRMSVYFLDIQVHYWVWAIGFVFLVGAVVSSFAEVMLHLLYFREPYYQKWIIRILFIVPIYATMSYCTLLFRSYGLIFDSLRNCYEAFVIYCFFRLLVEFMGGLRVLDENIMKLDPFRYPPPACCIMGVPTRNVFLYIQRGTLQYVIVKPITTFISLFAAFLGLYDKQSYLIDSVALWVAVINSISVTIALFSLMTFYVFSHDLLKNHNPTGKFLSIKFVIFLTFWQHIIIGLLRFAGLFHQVGDWTTLEIEASFEDLLLIIEMFAASIIHHFTFSHREYSRHRTGQDPIQRAGLREIRSSVGATLAVGDIVTHAYQVMLPESVQYKVEEQLPLKITSMLASASSDSPHDVFQHGEEERVHQGLERTATKVPGDDLSSHSCAVGGDDDDRDDSDGDSGELKPLI